MNEEIVSDYRKKSSNIPDILSKLNIAYALIIIIAAIILIKITSSNVNPRYHLVAYGAFLLIIAILVFRAKSTKKLIPREVAAQIAQEELNSMVRQGKQGFKYDSIVELDSTFQSKYKEDFVTGKEPALISYVFGFFEKVRGTNYKREGTISINPWDGNITAIKFMPFGYSGREEVDNIKIIPVAVTQSNFRMSDFGGEPKI